MSRSSRSKGGVEVVKVGVVGVGVLAQRYLPVPAGGGRAVGFRMVGYSRIWLCSRFLKQMTS